VPGAERHAGVDVGGIHPRALEQGDRVEQVGEQEPVHDEPGRVGDLDRRLAEGLAQRERALAGGGGGDAVEGELDELHLADRVEDVEGREALGAAGRRGEVGDAQRRGGRRDDRVRPRLTGEVGEEPALATGSSEIASTT
jgi:hypothetical protein